MPSSVSPSRSPWRSWLAGLGRHLQGALRRGRRDRMGTLLAALTLAFGLGATTALFSVFYGVLLRPLPYARSEGLVGLRTAGTAAPQEVCLNGDSFQRLRQLPQPLAALTAFSPASFNLGIQGGTERASGLYVAPDYLATFGLQPAFGRGFSREEELGRGGPVALVSHRLGARWGGGLGPLGRPLRLDGRVVTIVGVMPQGFDRIAQPGDMVDVWLPMALAPQAITLGDNLQVCGRLAPGVPPRRLASLSGSLTRAIQGNASDGSRPPIAWTPLLALRGLAFRPMVSLVLGAAGGVLLLACLNVANLLLNQAEARRREVALRQAVGASPRHLVTQFLAENLLLWVPTLVLGFGLAQASLRVLVALAPADLPRVDEIRLDGASCAFALLTALVCGVGLGILPALRACRVQVQTVLQGAADTFSLTRRGRRIRQGLVVATLGLTLLLLVGSALLFQTFWKVSSVRPGFEARGLTSLQVWLSEDRCASRETLAASYQQVVERTLALPGVRSAAVVAAGLPLERGGRIQALLPGQQPATVDVRIVTDDYLATLGAPLCAGRPFRPTDTGTSEPVLWINQALARQAFPGSDPMGQRITVAGPVARTVVGVVGDVRSALEEPAAPMVILPMAQASLPTLKIFRAWFPTCLLVRTAGPAGPVAARLNGVVQTVDPAASTSSLRSMDEVLAGSLASRRFQTTLLGAFAAVALVLTLSGVFSVVEENLAARQRELAVRSALGATPGHLARLILGGVLRLILAGVGLGLLASAALTHLLESLLVGVNPLDPMLVTLASLVLVAFGLLATLVPARRALARDPLRVLREG
jgi:putative ABC transport system permease protein